MEIIRYPRTEEWPALLRRPAIHFDDVADKVRPILEAVRRDGDRALLRWTEKLDRVKVPQLQVSREELAGAERQLPAALKTAIELARKNIEVFHRTQQEVSRKIETMPGVCCWRRSVPIDRVGLYIPGGTAPLFSTILMLAVPAQIAGCREIVLCTPPDPQGRLHPAVCFTARFLGLQRIFKLGGAQAIAALAYGTESVPRVDKIFGPGNQYVTVAKQLVSQDGVAIDLPAGPSELAVVADESANPAFVAADLLSQAEHGTDSQVLLITPSAHLLEQVQARVEKQLSLLPRREVAAQSLRSSRLFLVADLQEAMALSNAYAPEHLILAVAEPERWAEQVVNAGSVFLGHFSPESAGDYASGPNHTLPTNGRARAYSGVSLDSFVKKITFQAISPRGLQGLAPAVSAMAHAEGLEAHRQAVEIRLPAAGEAFR